MLVDGNVSTLTARERWGGIDTGLN